MVVRESSSSTPTMQASIGRKLIEESMGSRRGILDVCEEEDMPFSSKLSTSIRSSISVDVASERVVRRCSTGPNRARITSGNWADWVRFTVVVAEGDDDDGVLLADVAGAVVVVAPDGTVEVGRPLLITREDGSWTATTTGWVFP